MFFQQPSRYARRVYTEHVSRSQMHKFTAIQLFLFLLLYFVKSVKSIAIAFPLVIAACIPVRTLLLPKYFTREELIYIDGDDAEIEELEEEKRKLNAPPPTPALDEEKTGQRQTSGEISTKASSRQTS